MLWFGEFCAEEFYAEWWRLRLPPSSLSCSARPRRTRNRRPLLCGKTEVYGTWSTWPTGGYTGYPCAAQIDYATTPTGGANGSHEVYRFHLSSFGYYRVDVWVPCDHANAVMDWQTFVYGYFAYNIYDQVTHQADLCGWYTVTPVFYDGPNGTTGTLDISAYAWSGMVTPD